jgi:hypothetical protein
MRSAAWYPGRAVPVETWERSLREHGFQIHEAARRFLTEFGGLATDEWTPGPIMPQSPFRFDPRTAETAIETFARLSEKAGTPLYPIGQADSGSSYLGMAPNGAVYIGMDSPTLLADTPDKALEKLIEGIR